MSGDPTQDPMFAAGIDMLRRTGMMEFQVRYQDDEKPTVWIALARWNVDDDGIPMASGGAAAWKCAAAFHPTEAILKLCESAIDGGRCAHCAKPTAFVADIEPTLLDELICWTQWDPELNTFRRGCE